jgi:hypothetical protein
VVHDNDTDQHYQGGVNLSFQSSHRTNSSKRVIIGAAL